MKLYPYQKEMLKRLSGHPRKSIVINHTPSSEMGIYCQMIGRLKRTQPKEKNNE